MALVGWLAIAALLSLLWLKRASVIPVTLLWTYLIIPFAAGGPLTGGNGHPGTIIALVALSVCLFFRPKQLFRELGDHPLLYLGAASVTALLFTLLRFGSSGATIPVDTLAGPIIALILIRVSNRWGDVRIPLRDAAIILALLQVALALATWLAGRPFLFVERLSSYYWFSPDYTRGMGTTDHPLVLSLLLASTVPLIAGLKSAFAQLSIFAAIVVGLLLTESRTGLIAALVGGVYIVFRKGRTLGARIAAIVGGTVAVILMFQGPLATNLFAKFSDDGGSTSVRFAAIDAFLRRVGDYAIVGWGPGGSSALQQQEGLRSSLESAFLIYSVNYGVVFTLIYFSVALAFIIVGKRALPGAKLSALTALVMVQTFSGLATSSATAAILWIFIALASLSGPAPIDGAATEDEQIEDPATVGRNSSQVPPRRS